MNIFGITACTRPGATAAAARRAPTLLASVFMAVLVLSHAPAAHALMFDPTDAEWLTWPGYCKARSHEETDPRVRPADRAKWKASFTEAAWKPLHHYCAGIVKVVRAMREKQAERRVYFVKDAIKEYDYWLERVPPDDPFFATVLTAKAEGLLKLGKHEAAEKMLKSAIARTPDNTRPYLMLSLVYQDEKRLEDAREILLRANQAAKEKSAEVWYFLGLVNLKLRDYPADESAAQSAYALGYPLQGLKRKLKAQGYFKN